MEVEKEALRLWKAVAEGLNYVGTMAVELFVTAGGDVMVNEIAPRPHNSGHHTIDACRTNQFQQQLRAICGLPLGEKKIIAISGYRQFSTPYATAFGSVSDASFFGFYGPSPGRAALFMRILGYDNSLITTSSDLLSVYSGEIASMPIFPEEGSIACFGNINVVKLSD
jgi:hypothetical protein